MTGAVFNIYVGIVQSISLTFWSHVGVRVLEVREAYAREDFEWDHLQRLSSKALKEGNVKLMRQHAEQAFKGAFETKRE